MIRDYSHRMGSKKVKFVYRDGTPVAFKEVKAEMTCHEFLFGTRMFDVIPYISGEMTCKEKEQYQINFEKWIALCNNATFPFYWQKYEPEYGKPRIRQTMEAAEWLKKQNVLVKGHPLCWHTLTAPWLLEMTNQEIRQAQVDRIHREVTAFKGVIDMWDVMNEVVIMPVFDKYENGITRICKEAGRVNTVKTMFEAARKSNPDGVLLINDFNLSDKYKELIRGCLEEGVTIDGIGLQTHQHQGYLGEEKLYQVLERFEKFQKPLHFTEITLTSGHIMPSEIKDLNDYQIKEWPTTPKFEDRQAREFAEICEILFAHPLVSSAVSWGFIDGGWLDAPSGLLRKDGSGKPVYDALYELFRKKWWTKTKTVTDEFGEATIEGYRGEYSLTCLDQKVSVSLEKQAQDNTAVFKFHK